MVIALTASLPLAVIAADTNALLNAAQSGDRDAQYQLAMKYLTGAGLQKNIKKALTWLTRAGKQGHPRAQFFLGQFYRSGMGVEKDLVEARKWFRLAATWGDIDAQNAYNELKRREVKEKLQQVRVKAEAGDLQALHQLASWHLEGESGAEKSSSAAIHWFTRAAQEGYMASQYQLGLLYKSGGDGFKKDLSQARKWLTLAHEQGSAEARVLLQDISRQQQGSGRPLQERISKLARRVPFEKEAKQGDAQAQYKLGLMYIRGEGVKLDPVVGLAWLRKSAGQNNINAQIHLGQLLMRGLYVDKDYDESAMWYQRAANAGDAEAQYMLANMFRAGLGVDKDQKQAEQLYSAAAKQGHAKAKARMGIR